MVVIFGHSGQTCFEIEPRSLRFFTVSVHGLVDGHPVLYFLVNYRRFISQHEIPLDPGVNLVFIPPGRGRSTLPEAIPWCLLDNDMVATRRRYPTPRRSVGAGQRLGSPSP